MWRSMTMGLALGTAMLMNVVPAYAQRWGREATPRSGVCFYEDANFGGRYFCSSTGSSMTQVANNDQISSIRIFGDAVATVYRDSNFRGQSKVITSSVNNLRSVGFNDRISSFQVDSNRGYSNYPNYPNNSNYPNNNGRWSRNTPPPYGNANGARWNYRDAEQVVRRSYRSVLGRDPDPQGLRNWTEQVLNNNWTERDLENALRQSDEYRALRQNGDYRARRR
jgi:hypothetical protein